MRKIKVRSEVKCLFNFHKNLKFKSIKYFNKILAYYELSVIKFQLAQFLTTTDFPLIFL